MVSFVERKVFLLLVLFFSQDPTGHFHEFNDRKMTDATATPFRVPAQYVQLVTALRPSADNTGHIDVENGHSDDGCNALSPTAIKLEPSSTVHTPPTDFENLIEMNARKADPSIAKTCADTLASPTSITSPSTSSFSAVTKGQNGLLKIKQNSILQQMDIDECPSSLPPNPALMASMKFPLNVENKLINKVKIVVDNMTSGASSIKQRLDIDANGYHLLHQVSQPPPLLPHQSPFQSYNFHSSFHLYEYNQNNQNYLNQHRLDPNNPDNQIDENMWRPW